MSTTYGLTLNGFVLKPQQEIIAEQEDFIRGIYGQNANLAAESNLGQIVGYYSEREAFLWELLQAVVNGYITSAAEGTSVDNLLALTGMRRLKATPTRTNPTPLTEANGITEYGLVLYGVAGTVIPAGSIIQTTASPPLSATLDAPVTIAAAQDAVQSLFESNTPDSGQFSIGVTDLAGNAVQTAVMPYNVLPQISTLAFATVPGSGAFALTLTLAGAALVTGSLPFNATAGQIQTAIRALTGYSAVTVTGSMAAGFQIAWGAIGQPLLTVSTNTTTVSTTVVDSFQAKVNNIHDSVAANYPYTDVLVTAGATGFNMTFGALAAVVGQPTTGALAQPLFTVASNTMMAGSNVTNIKIVNSVVGAPAQGIGAATCTVTGINFIGANTLTVIGSPRAGWTGVTNQLDCLTGTNVETDTEAMVRRAQNLQANANGPLDSIVEKVRALTGVTNVKGFQNLYNAALQLYAFNITPSSGVYQLVVGGHVTSALAYNASGAAVQAAIRALPGYGAVLVTGDYLLGFTVDFNGSMGGQSQPQIQAVGNTTGSTLVFTWGRPGNSFEIVVQGGADVDIVNTIFKSGPAGIQSYGSTTLQVIDNLGNPFYVSFSRPTAVALYAVISMVTDLTTEAQPAFNPGSVATIQKDIVDVGNLVGIGGLVIGFGTNGIVGCFNAVPGIISYDLKFGRAPNPTGNANIQLQPEEVPLWEEFNVSVSYV